MTEPGDATGGDAATEAVGDPYAAAGPHRGLDPALDPDRYQPEPDDAAAPQVQSAKGVGTESDVLTPPAVAHRRLDPRLDPDRYANQPAATRGKDLTELIGKDRSYEEERSPYLWLVGLAMVLGFLALVSLVFANLSPR